MNAAISDGKTGYCPAAGIAPLREALAANIGADRGMELTAENIVVQPGGKPVITKFIQTLMNPGDGVLYPNPGYPIYESQVEYFGGRPLPYRYHETGHRVRHRPRSTPCAGSVRGYGHHLQQPAEPAGLREFARRDASDRRHRH